MPNIKPAHLKELNGSAKHNSNRVNKDQPVPMGGIGPAPEYFSEEESKLWDEVVTFMYAGVMGEADRFSFEVMVKLFFRFRYADPSGEGEVQPLNGTELGKMISLFSLFGLTPVDRQKVSIPKTKQDNPFAGL